MERILERLEGGEQHTYIAIDLKSFYASVECRERGLDPLTTHLVVADESRTEKTICLAVTPSLKRYGISGRARLFEVTSRMREVNARRRAAIGGKPFSGKSVSEPELEQDPTLEADFIAATPRMAYYMEYSSRIFQIYMRFIAPEDVHVYSVDEVFLDVTHYLNTYGMSAHDLAIRMIREVLSETGITATAGIGTNLYLAKIAMDIVAKHMPADADGVRIAELDELTYRQKLWHHRPLTDFWRVGGGISRRLEKAGLHTMGDIARCSLGRPEEYYNEELLYKLFGVNAELLIDHAWGWENTTIDRIREYVPESNSISSGQVLQCPYSFEKGRLIVKEMTDLLVLDLVDKRLVTDQIVLTVGYDVENLQDPELVKRYLALPGAEITADRYGRQAPKNAHGSIGLGEFTSSTKSILEAVTKLYDRIVIPFLTVRRMYVVANHVKPESVAWEEQAAGYEQLDLFTDYEALEREREEKRAARERERGLQEAVLSIQKRYGKNAILKGMNFEEGAMTIERNGQVGGHKA